MNMGEYLLYPSQALRLSTLNLSDYLFYQEKLALKIKNQGTFSHYPISVGIESILFRKLQQRWSEMEVLS